MAVVLLVLLLFSSLAALRFAARRGLTSPWLFRLEPSDEGSGDGAAGAPPVADAGIESEPRVAGPGFENAPPAAEPAYEAEPPVAIVVPARNEENSLEDALASLARLDYSSYRIWVVNDESTDQTVEIADAFAERDPRIRRIDAAGRPPGWGGKTWAMECGVRASDEAWVLFTDADVTHHRASLRRALERARETGAGAVSVLPYLRCESVAERLVLPAFIAAVTNRFPPGRVRDPRSRTAATAGGFLLVHRDALARAGGLEAVRGVVAEDIALGARLKAAGVGVDLSFTRELVATRMYASLGEMVDGLGKHAYEGMGRSAALLALGILGAWIVAVLPFALLVTLGAASPILGLPLVEGPLPKAQAVICAVAAANYIGLKKLYEEIIDFLDVPFGYAWLYPIGALGYGLIAARSLVLHVSGRGTKWKGRRAGG